MGKYDLEQENRKAEKSVRGKKRKKKKTGLFLLAGSALIMLCAFGVLLMKIYGKTDEAAAGWKTVAASEENKAASAAGTAPEWETVPSAETGKSASESGTDQTAAETVRKNSYGKITEKQLTDKKDLTFLFAGDLLLDDHYAPMIRLKSRKNGILDCFSPETLQLMQNADFFMLNNEFPYTDRGTPTEGKKYTFHAKPENAVILNQLGVDMVALANNHAYDYGETSLLDTLDTLNKEQMPYAGAGHNLEEAASPVVVWNHNMKIAVFCATQIERLDNPDTKGAGNNTPGVFRCWQNDQLVQAVKEAGSRYDFVIVYVHWGTESTTEVDSYQKQLAQQLADAGAGIVIGDHPHVLQGITWMKQTPVIYSMGNYWFNSAAMDTGLMQMTLENKKIQKLQFIPARQADCYTQVVSGNDKSRIIGNMRQMSAGVTIDDDGTIHAQGQQ